MAVVIAILIVPVVLFGSFAWLWYGLAKVVPATVAVIGFCESIFVRCLGYLDILTVALLWAGVALLCAGLVYALFTAISGVIRARLAIKRLPLKNIGSISLIDDEGSFCAFTHGIVRPRIYLSKGLLKMLERSELRGVFFHELHHKRGLDPLKFFISKLLADTFFYIPVAGHAARGLRLRKELEADDAAVARMDEPVSLAAALVKAARLNNSVPEYCAPSFSSLYPQGMTAGRIRRLIEKKDMAQAPVRASSVCMSLFAAALVAVSLALPLKAGLVSAQDCTTQHCSIHIDRLGAECRTHCSPTGRHHIHRH